ncbi:MAG: hypothetical protein WBB74_09105 [Gaiellaceae bacterium]
MRKLILFLVITVTAVLAAGVASATAGSIYATGAGWVSFQPFTPKHYIHFDVSAHTGPSGDFGHLGFTVNDPTFPLDVRTTLDCVNVFAAPLVNGDAWVSGTVTSVSPQPNAYGVMPGDRQETYLVDGGNPSATTPVDTFDPFLGEIAPCKTLGDFGSFPDVTQGNINISTG